MSGHHTLVGSSRPHRVGSPVRAYAPTAKLWIESWRGKPRIPGACPACGAEVEFCGAATDMVGAWVDAGTDVAHEHPAQ